MQIEVLENPNCRESDQIVFSEIGSPRPIEAIRAEFGGRETVCDVTGVEPGGRWVAARAVKVNDSSAGVAYLIFGGLWGLRLKPHEYSNEPWDFANTHQWGEPFKVYGDEHDIFYAKA